MPLNQFTKEQLLKLVPKELLTLLDDSDFCSFTLTGDLRHSPLANCNIADIIIGKVSDGGALPISVVFASAQMDNHRLNLLGECELMGFLTIMQLTNITLAKSREGHYEFLGLNEHHLTYLTQRVSLADSKSIQSKISLAKELSRRIRQEITLNFTMPQLLPGMVVFTDLDGIDCEEVPGLIVDHKTLHKLMDLVHSSDSDYADMVKLMEGKGYFESFTTSYSLDGYVCVILGAERSMGALVVSWLAFKR